MSYARNGFTYSLRGFIITSKSTKEFKKKNNFGDEFTKLKGNLNWIQEKTNLQVGNPEKPLILSVRSGSYIYAGNA